MEFLDIATMIGSVVGSGAIAGTITTIIYRKQNTRLKNDEVQKAETTTDQQQIDLGDLFLEKTQKWAQVIEESANKMVESNRKRDDDWRELKQDMDYVKKEVGSMSEYLNGGYADFKRNKENSRYGKTRKKTAATKK